MDPFLWIALVLSFSCLIGLFAWDRVQDRRAVRKTRRQQAQRIRTHWQGRPLHNLHVIDGDESTV